MTSQMPCPRCTQLLPTAASFCRRCGLAVQGRPPRAGPGPAAASRGWSGRLAFAIVVLAGVNALLFAAATVRHVPAPTVASRPPVVVVPAVPAAPPHQRVTYPPVIRVVPQYPPTPSRR